MPKTCKGMVKNVIKPKLAFLKKKDADAHIALRAIKKLHKGGYLNDHLFPN